MSIARKKSPTKSESIGHGAEEGEVLEYDYLSDITPALSGDPRGAYAFAAMMYWVGEVTQHSSEIHERLLPLIEGAINVGYKYSGDHKAGIERYKHELAGD
jgi:hypothetical protein